MVESNKMKLSFTNLDRIYVEFILFCNTNTNTNTNTNNNNNNSNNNNNNVYSQNFFMTRRDNQLISIYLKIFLLLLRSFSLIASSRCFV